MIAGAIVLTALMAQVKVYLPNNPVPITLQVFVVLLVGLTLTPTSAFTALLGYLALLAAGLPIGAGGTGGLSLLGGATAGYLLAFPFAAFATARLKQAAFFGGSLVSDGIAVLGGLLVIYGLGAGWLGIVLGNARDAWVLGVAPFILVDGAKAILAVTTARALQRIPRRG